MTDQYSTPVPMPTYPATPEPAPKKQRWFKKPAVLIGAAFVLGSALGLGATPEPKTVEVIKEVPGPERVVTKTEKVSVPTTPAVCIEALDLAGAGIALLAQIPEHASDGIMAAGTGNTAVLTDVTRKMEALNKKIDAASGPLGVAAQSCRASAK